MYFYKKNGKQHLDLKGDLILSHNDALVKTRTKSAGPVSVKAPDGFILNIGKAGFFKRVTMTWNIIKFVWSKDRSLKITDTDHREPLRVVGYNPEKLKTPDIHNDIRHLDESDDPDRYCEKHGGTGFRAYCITCINKAI